MRRTSSIYYPKTYNVSWAAWNSHHSGGLFQGQNHPKNEMLPCLYGHLSPQQREAPWSDQASWNWLPSFSLGNDLLQHPALQLLWKKCEQTSLPKEQHLHTDTLAELSWNWNHFHSALPAASSLWAPFGSTQTRMFCKYPPVTIPHDSIWQKQR